MLSDRFTKTSYLMLFRLQIPMPAKPAPSNINEAGSGTPTFFDKRLPWPSP